MRTKHAGVAGIALVAVVLAGTLTIGTSSANAATRPIRTVNIQCTVHTGLFGETRGKNNRPLYSRTGTNRQNYTQPFQFAFRTSLNDGVGPFSPWAHYSETFLVPPRTHVVMRWYGTHGAGWGKSCSGLRTQ